MTTPFQAIHVDPASVKREDPAMFVTQVIPSVLVVIPLTVPFIDKNHLDPVHKIEASGTAAVRFKLIKLVIPFVELAAPAVPPTI